MILTKRKLVKKFAFELAYLQMKSDEWLYLNHNQNLSDYYLRAVSELRAVIVLLNLPIKKIYEEAKKIYDFTNSGKNGYEPDPQKIKNMIRFFEDWAHKRPFM